MPRRFPFEFLRFIILPMNPQISLVIQVARGMKFHLSHLNRTTNYEGYQKHCEG